MPFVFQYGANMLTMLQRMWNVVINRLLAGVILMQCIMLLSA